LFLWASFILFCTVLAFTYSTYGDETARLAGLRANEHQKEEAYASLERARAQTYRYVERFVRDPEFVRDQARERMGVAEPGEIVIRVDGARNMATPQKPAPAPAAPAQASR
jgi:cell division protein FtsB